jgi:hypothetical protein
LENEDGDNMNNMKIKDFLRLKKHVQGIINPIINDSLETGEDVESGRFKEAMNILKKRILDKKGIDFEEYKKLEDEMQDDADILESEILYFPGFAKKQNKKMEIAKDELRKNILSAKDELSLVIGSAFEDAKNRIEESGLSSRKDMLEEIERVNNSIKEITNKHNGLSKLTADEINSIIMDLDAVKSELVSLVDSVGKAYLSIEDKLSKKDFEKVNVLEEKIMALDEYIKKLEKTIKSIPTTGKTMIVAGTSNDENISSWFKSHCKKETPSGSVNGTNTVFTMTKTPMSESLVSVYINGQYQKVSEDYTRSGTSITFSIAPPSGSIIEVIYYWIN